MLATQHSPKLDRYSIEETWTRVARNVGGSLVSDLLPRWTDLPKNADFVFPDYKVIAELKRLEHDSHLDREIPRKINELYRRWVYEGKVVPIYGTVSINLRTLPIDCAEEVISLYRNPIKRRIRKANEQIKSTKSLLGMEDALGLLIFVHDGDYSLTQEMVLALVYRCLRRGDFKGIDSLTYVNMDMKAVIPGTPTDYKLFLHTCRDPARQVPSELVESLQNSWYSEIQARFGFSLPRVVVKDPARFIDRFRYVRT
ncbi:MAG: hypothetical protein WB678_05275 [Stellaceae bacterium]